MITEWWQQLIFYTLSILLGGFLGYFLSRLGAKRERKIIAEEHLQNAGLNILVELKVNLEIAKQPSPDILVPFVTGAWETYQGEISRLPKDLQDTLYQVYVEIQTANALVDANVRLEHGRDYYRKPYKEKSGKLEEKAKVAVESLKGWLKKQGVEVSYSNAKRQSP